MRKFPHLLIAALLVSQLTAQEPSSESPEPTENPENPFSEDSPEPELEIPSEDKTQDGVVIRTEIPKQITVDKDSADFKLLSPWAPKPLQAAPIGWRYIAADPAQSYKTSVKLSTGKNLFLKVTPYVLVPEDSPEVVQVLEPGYIPNLGYRQTQSVTSTLESSNQLLLKSSELLVNSIANLEELLLTLPTPEDNNPAQP